VSNRWDDRYRSGEMGDKPAEPLLSVAAASATVGEALDVACGSGRHAVWLAQRGWRVTAVDYSKIALRLLEDAAGDLPIRTRRADLEEGEFEIEPDRYNLIVDTCFLYRPLFAPMRNGLLPGGVFFGVFPLEGLNSAFLIGPGELRGYFDDWEVLHYTEGRPSEERRPRAEIIARRPASSER
jgi:tellurite methyltransferase